ncbi:MAG: hypothetical protein IJ272_04740, partial [Clostridia bacterium]|nr:hypothetical protein [Clostridia bacterium]
MLTRKPLTSNTCLLSNKINYTDNKEVTNEVILGTSAANITDYNGGVVAFSPNNDKNMDEVYAGVTQLRNGYHIKLHILDSNFNKLRELGSASLLARSSYLELCKSSCKRLVSSNLNN